MAEYKVPQDVEADDKLIGPFSFRQFVYLIIVALAIALAWGLAQLFIGLAIIPLPVILFFGALALPLRKDQPMEIYLAAIVSFYIKPHKRLWDADGVDSLIEITAPKVEEVLRTKNITQADAAARFGYLANIVDSQGWAIRDVNGMPQSTVMNGDILLEARSANDMLDTSGSIGQSMNAMMAIEADRIRQEAINRMREPAAAPTTPPPAISNPYNDFTSTPPTYNPYPTDIQQTVIQPVDDDAHIYTPPVATQNPLTTSDVPVSAGIMNLANNADLSIETIAHEAQRLEEKKISDDEVVISLR